MKKINVKIPRLSRVRKKISEPGFTQGSMASSKDLPKTLIKKYIYDAKEFQETTISLNDFKESFIPIQDKVVWIDVQGVNDEAVITKIAEHLELQGLTLEDILHLNQRPKFDDFEKYLYVVLRNVFMNNSISVSNEQISIIIKKGLLVTFQERHNGVLSLISERIKANKGFIRKHGIDYLLYAIIDIIIDNYFPVLETFADVMEDLDESLLRNPSHEISRAIHQMKRELRHFRKAVWPLRDMIGKMSREDFPFIGKHIKSFYSDCYDNVIQVVDFIENSKERVFDLANQYLTQVNERTNQVMKTLTIIATIFIPLTFLCGVYGMNFDTSLSSFNMPELKWKYGYMFFWFLTLLITAGMLIFFWFKGWFGNKKT